MRKTILTLIILGLLSVLRTQSVEAHVLAVDKSIGAVLHIDPDDDPIAGQQSSFFFEFKDTTNKFKPSQCDCTFSIFEHGKEIITQPLFQNTTNPTLANASVFYTFSKSDVYQVKVTGKPTPSDAFQPFILTYNIRVEPSTNQSKPRTQSNFLALHYIHFIIFGGVFIIFFIISAINKKRNKTPLS